VEAERQQETLKHEKMGLAGRFSGFRHSSNFKEEAVMEDPEARLDL
jgi:hypothetical protein